MLFYGWFFVGGWVDCFLFLFFLQIKNLWSVLIIYAGSRRELIMKCSKKFKARLCTELILEVGSFA